MSELQKPEEWGLPLREQFPVLASGLYFNHAAIGPWPRCTAAAVERFAEENLHHGSAGYPDWIRRAERLRANLAHLIGAPSVNDIALLNNTTEGINIVAEGLDWHDGDNVVLPIGEFPSNHLPWQALQARGVRLREVDIRAAGNAERALVEAMGARTRVLSVSAVQWTDGFRLDLTILGAACRKRGVLFFVDAIQQVGALPLDCSAAHIDFLAADGHKWLLAPEGIALFYARPEARERLRLTRHGWHMLEDRWNFDKTEQRPSRTATRFEAGSPNSLGQAALDASVGMLLHHGMDSLGSQVLANTALLMEELPRLPGVRLLSRPEANRRSGIVTFQSERIPPSDLYRRLQSAGVACALRGNGIRLSPHFYQGEKQLGALLQLLAEELARP